MKLKLKSRPLFLFTLLLLLGNQPVLADGMFLSDTDLDNWVLQTEDQQLCAINYENGIQNTILAVDINDMQGERAVWIFPVPSKPDETKIDIIRGFPGLRGQDVVKGTGQDISLTFGLMRLSQIYTLPVFLLFNFGMAGSLGPQDGIIIHEHIDKMGMSTELITAENGSAFYNYLMNKGLDLPSPSRSILDDYMGEDYTFVVSWISDVQQFSNNTNETSQWRNQYGEMINSVGISINFPTNRIYFPLKPTSVYGEVEIPILIYVMGHVTPELYPEIQAQSQINYFEQYYAIPDELSSFFNNREDTRLKYTKIKVETASINLKNDLWMNNSPPSEIVFLEKINNNLRIIGLLIFILSSCLASMFAGMIIYRNDQPSKPGFFSFGILNFLTLIGFAIAANLLKINTQFTRDVEQNTADFNKILKVTLIISAFITFPFLLFSIFDYIFYFDIAIVLAYLLIYLTIIFVILLPFIDLHYRNKKLLNFVIVFSILFFVITFVFQIIFLGFI